MALKAGFRKAAIHVGFTQPTDRELLQQSVADLIHEIDLENHLGVPPWQRKFMIDTPPPPYTIEVTDLKVTDTEDTKDKITGIFVVKNNITKCTDEIDFIANVHKKRDGNYVPDKFNTKSEDGTFLSMEEYEHDRYVKLVMPHWKFPRFITDRIARMDMINTLKTGEAEDRVGLKASLKLLGFEF